MAVAKRIVGLLAAGKVAVHLGLGDRGEGSARIVLRGVPDAPTAIEPRSSTSLIAADALPAVERSERPEQLPFPQLIVMSRAKPASRRPPITALEVALDLDLPS